MIQINLLPEVKQEYLKAQQMKHIVLVSSILTTLIIVTLTVLFFVYVSVIQPQYQIAVQKDIDSSLNDLKQKSDAQRIVTVQGVLEQIPGLKDKQLVTSRIFDYLKQFTPRNVTYSRVNVNLETGTLTLTGSSNSYEDAQVLANNLKSAQFSYYQNDSQQTLKPFSEIIFSSLSKSESNKDGKAVSFEITFKFDSSLFTPGISKQTIKVNASSEKLLLPETKPFSEQPKGESQ